MKILSIKINLEPFLLELKLKVYMNDREITGMTKKLPSGHNIGGGNRQKRRQAYKLEKKNSE